MKLDVCSVLKGLWYLHNYNIILCPCWAGDKICMINPPKNITTVLEPLGCIITLQTQWWNQNKNRINGSGDITNFRKEKGMLSNFHNHIFVFYKWLGCILILQMHGHILNNVQINSFFLKIFVILWNRKPMISNPRDIFSVLWASRVRFDHANAGT
jgi:hypothetical protein